MQKVIVDPTMMCLLGTIIRPSFLDGMSRVLDMGATLKPPVCPVDPQKADYLALLSDWTAVGNDIRSSLVKFAFEIEEDKDIESVA